MKCGNCNIDFPNRKAMIAHMAIVHNSYFDLTSHPEYSADDLVVRGALTPASMATLSKVLSGQ